MTKLFVLILLLIYGLSSVGQRVEQKVEIFTKEIDVDAFYVYSFPCIGYIYSIDSCQRKDTHYLLWTKNNNYFIKRFENCSVSLPIQLDTLNPLKFYILNKHFIDKEELKPPTYYEYKKRNNKIDTLMWSSSIDHSCHHKFVYNVGGKSVEKWYDTYDLNFIKFDNGQKNIYYDFNQRTKSNSLINQMNKLLDLYKSSKKFQVE